MKKLFAALGAILSVLYLINPVDIIPDAVLPVGLLDDAAVIPILLACLRTLGFDASRLLGRKPKKDKADDDTDVIDVES